MNEPYGKEEPVMSCRSEKNDPSVDAKQLPDGKPTEFDDTSSTGHMSDIVSCETRGLPPQSYISAQGEITGENEFISSSASGSISLRDFFQDTTTDKSTTPVAMSTSSADGIFDDADEDCTSTSCSVPMINIGVVPVTQPGRSSDPGEGKAGQDVDIETGSGLKRRRNIRPNRKKAKRDAGRSRKKAKKEAMTSLDKNTEELTKKGRAAEKGGKETRKKRPRRLSGNAEKESADTILSNATDLSLLLPAEDCTFLAERLWIFTAQQLDTALNDDSSESQEQQNPSSADNVARVDTADAPKSEEDTHSSSRSQCIMRELRAHWNLFQERAGTRATRFQAGEEFGSREKELSFSERRGASISYHEDGARGESGSMEETNDANADTGPMEPDLSSSISASTDGLPSCQKKLVIDGAERNDLIGRLRRWQDTINMWKEEKAIAGEETTEGTTSNDTRGSATERRKPCQFSLNEQLSSLFAPSVVEFLNSIGIQDAHTFLSARKTESSLLISQWSEWRAQHNLVPLKNGSLAHHMIGLSLRLRTALSSPSADEFTREWMSGPLVVLTGSGRDFLINERRTCNVETFLNTRTRDLAAHMAEWRASKGMPELKGGGKVATISVWKTSVKEALEIECDAAIEAESLEREREKLVRSADAEGCSNGQRERGRSPARSPLTTSDVREGPGSSTLPNIETTEDADVQEVSLREGAHFDSERSTALQLLKSPIFLCKCLKPDQVKFLASIGISTAAALITARKTPKSPAVAAMLEWRSRGGNRHIQTSSCVRTLFDWAQITKDKVDKLVGMEEESLFRKRGRPRGGKKETLANFDEPTEVSGPESSPSVEVGPDGSSQDLVSVNSGIDDDVVSSSDSNDPIEVLSNATRFFLTAQGITKAEHLLSTKTSIVSRAFIQWRSKHGMAELKGYGATAQVSAWKRMVREAARRQGLDELLDVSPKKPGGSPPSGSAKEEKTAEATITPVDDDDGSITFVSHPRLLYGFPYRTFTVCNTSQGTLYDFKLSVRKASVADAPYRVFLTYLGARQAISQPSEKSEVDATSSGSSVPTLKLPGSNGKKTSQPILELMQDVAFLRNIDENDFVAASSITWSSAGLIDLSQKGAFPDESSTDDRVQALTEAFQDFISKKEDEPTPTSEIDFGSSNSGPTARGAMFNNHTADEDEASRTKSVIDEGANVFRYVDTEKDRSSRFLFIIDGEIEKGQTVELVLNDSADGIDQVRTNKHGSGHQKIIELASSLSLAELQVVVGFLYEQFKPISSQLKTFIENAKKEIDSEEVGIGEASTPSYIEASGWFARRRRIHWIASRLHAQFRELRAFQTFTGQTPELSDSDICLVESRIREMQWGPLCKEADLLLVWNDGVLFELLQEEVIDEITALAGSFGCLKDLSDPSTCCALSADFAKDLRDTMSEYILTNLNDSSVSQRELAERIVQITSQAVMTLEECCKHNGKEMSHKLSFQPKSGCDQSSEDQNLTRELLATESQPKVRKEITACQADVQAYKDAMDLCGEADVVSEIISQNDTHQGCSTVMTRVPFDVKAYQSMMYVMGEFYSGDEMPRRTDTCLERSSASIHKDWYLINQLLLVLYSLTSSGAVNWIQKSTSEDGMCNFPSLLVSMLDSALNMDVTTTFQLFTTSQSRILYAEAPQLVRSTKSAMPKTLPLFLKLVWPICKRNGWRLDAKGDPDDIIFVPPCSLAHKRKAKALEERRRKEEAAQKRAKLSMELEEANLPILPRPLKHILINSIEYMAENGLEEVEGVFPSATPVASVLDLFLDAVSDQLGDTGEAIHRTRVVIKGTLDLFDTMLPTLLTSAETTRHDAAIPTEGPRSSEIYGCEYLLRLFVFLPGHLRECKVAVEERSRIMTVIEDVCRFLNSNHSGFFHTIYQPPNEVLSNDDLDKERPLSDSLVASLSGVPTGATGSQMSTGATGSTSDNLATPLEESSPQGDDVDGEGTLIRAEDKSITTDFTFYVLSQVDIYHATPEDVAKGRRKGSLRAGNPGMICRHCRTYTDDGNKYFFSTKPSLGTAASVIMGHMQRCSYCPSDVKNLVKSYKMKHSAQRKALQFGSQSLFYSQLWERLFSAPRCDKPQTIASVAGPDEYDEIETGSEDDESSVSNLTEVLKSHTKVLELLSRSDTWRNKSEFTHSLSEYYSAIALGGRIWNTEAMPMHCTSEWILKQKHAKEHRGGHS